MKKNDGFIATSVLYSFFLIFLTLFVALLANYLHNKLLINKINEEAINKVLRINSFKLTDLEVGDRIKLKLNDNNHILNPDGIWTLAHVIKISNEEKRMYFLSDLKMQEMDVYCLANNDSGEDYHVMSVDLYEQLQTQGAYDKTIKYPGFEIRIPTSSFINLIRESDIKSDIKEALLNPGGEYLIYQDKTEGGYIKDEYYSLRAYNFSKNTSPDLVEKYCGAKLDEDLNASYLETNKTGYLNVVKESLVNDRYSNYCYYASPVKYTHLKDEGITDIDEVDKSDRVIEKYNSNYSFRLLAVVTLRTDLENIYISDGRGTLQNPYNFETGVKQS